MNEEIPFDEYVKMMDNLESTTDNDKDIVADIAEEIVDTDVEPNVIMEENQKSKRKISCNICKITFRARSYYLEHMSGKHSDMRYQCTGCNRKFQRERVAKKHIRVSCDGFLILVDKRDPNIQHFKRNKQPQMICDYCGLSHKNKSELLLHMESKHLGIVYECGHCKRVFKKKFTATRHQKKSKEPRCKEVEIQKKGEM